MLQRRNHKGNYKIVWTVWYKIHVSKPVECNQSSTQSEIYVCAHVYFNYYIGEKERFLNKWSKFLP